MTENDAELGILLGPYTLNIISKYFVQWSHDVFNYNVSDEDIGKLEEGHTDLLTKTAKQYFDIFYDSLKDYVNMCVSVKKNMLV